MTVREMKDSGVEWIGLIPEHWGTLSLQYLLSFSGSGTTPKRLDMLVCEDGNGINWLNTGDLTDGYIENIPQKLKTEVMHQYSTLRLYPSGSLVIALYGATAGKLGILLEPSTTNQACCVLVPNKDLLNLKYLFYQLFAARSSLISLAKGGGQPNISQETVRKFKVCFTDLQEQKKIANFLDSKCAEIDALKADIEKQIETLQEYKKSVITEAVTKGLDPNVEMKDSGVEWVGVIPKCWQLHPIYFYFTERKCLNKAGKEQNLLSLSYGKIVKKDISTHEGLLPASFNTYNIISSGDIVFRLTDLQNDKRSLRTALSRERGIITSAYVTISPKTEMDTRFYHYLFHAYDINKVFYNLGNGVRQGLNYSELSRLMALEPPKNEQIAIANFLDTKCAEIDAIILGKKNQLDTLVQYKQSLIYEYVTGKKAVPANF